jgi:tetratricopeptide (TPR) repeat protein
VVVGAIGGGGRQEQLALGETPNIAARIQSQAAPDEVMISAATYRLVEGLFVCEDRGRPELKGVAALLRLYRVVKEGEAQNRFQVVARKGLTPLVGREHEYGLLRERWARVQDGAGQVVLLSGEPGIGKSRLVEALKENVGREGAPCLELRCSPYYQNSALYPIIDHLQRLLQFVPEEPPDAKLEKLQQRLLRYRFPQPETLPLLAALLSLPSPAGAPPLALSPQKQKERTLETVVSWLVEETERGPLACAWEDLHWADPSTLELLTLLLEQVPTTRMLVLLTFRPEFTPPWGVHSYLSQVTLSRLGLSEVEMMVGKVAGSKALPKEVVRQIASKTDGVPLFVEELTKMVVESDLLREVDGRYELNGPLPPLDSLHAARLAHGAARSLGDRTGHRPSGGHEESQDSGQLMEAYYTLGYTLSTMGRTVEGQAILKPGTALYDLDKHGSLAQVYSFDPGGGCFNWVAFNLWLLGYPDQALAKIEEALVLMQKLSHPFSSCFTLIFAGYIHRYRHEWRRAQEYAEEVIRIATEHEFPHWVQYGEILQGSALAHQGWTEEGIADIRRGLAGQRAIGTEAARAWFLSFLVEVYQKEGQLDEGWSTLAEALPLVDKTGEHFYEAELYRLKGELILQQFKVQGSKFKGENPQSEAEACFLKAIEIARSQKAKSWELRAAASLARFWQQQGKRQEAHRMLSEVYNWFTEGFDTKDLQEAKALLETLR